MPYDAEITTKSRDLIVLEKARERIARGWCHGSLEQAGEVCFVGGVSFGLFGLARYPEMPLSGYTRKRGELDRVLGLLGFKGVAQAEVWNDAPGRTQAQVLARFDEAIERLRSAG